MTVYDLPCPKCGTKIVSTARMQDDTKAPTNCANGHTFMRAEAFKKQATPEYYGAMKDLTGPRPIQVQAAKRIKALDTPNLPPWYERSRSQVGNYKFVSGARPFPRTTLIVQDRSPNGEGGTWIGSWSVDFTGEIQIFIQQKMVKACTKHDAQWVLVHILQHEYVEAKEAIKEARAKYPGSNPYIMVERDVSLGGKAHLAAIRILDGISEALYDKSMHRVLKMLNLA